MSRHSDACREHGTESPDDGRVEAVHEELNEFDTDLAMGRENRDRRARRITATVEQFTYTEVAALLRGHGLNTLANHYESKANAAEVRGSQKGHD